MGKKKRKEIPREFDSHGNMLPIGFKMPVVLTDELKATCMRTIDPSIKMSDRYVGQAVIYPKPLAAAVNSEINARLKPFVMYYYK